MLGHAVINCVFGNCLSIADKCSLKNKNARLLIKFNIKFVR